MTLQEYEAAIASGGEGYDCPFLERDDDHLEVQNTSEFFEFKNGEYKLKANIVQRIQDSKYDTVVFYNEVTGGYDPVACLNALAAATTPPAEGETND